MEASYVATIEGDNTAMEDVDETPTEVVMMGDNIMIVEDGKTTKKDSETKDVSGESNNIWPDSIVVSVLDICENNARVVENSDVDKKERACDSLKGNISNVVDIVALLVGDGFTTRDVFSEGWIDKPNIIIIDTLIIRVYRNQQ